MAKIAQNWYNSPSIHAKVGTVLNLKKFDRGILKLLPFKVSGCFTRVLMRNRSMFVYKLIKTYFKMANFS
jgi:hypothetical protein